MAHLAPSFTSYASFLDDADEFYAADLIALNSSGVSGQALFAIDTDSNMLNVLVTADGLAPGEIHVQHIHGLFDEDGDAANSVPPTLQDDADFDGFVEVLEGVPSYGDILLPLLDSDNDETTNDTPAAPVADAQGNLLYFETFDLTDASNFFSPVTGANYTAEDIMPLILREYVIHGVNVPSGYGEGTDGEIDGTQDGYVPILPAASSEIVEISGNEAETQLEMQMQAAGLETLLTGGDDVYRAGGGMDTVSAGRGDDLVYGGAGNDVLGGNAGADSLFGDEGDDLVNGGRGEDKLYGGVGHDVISGGFDADVIYGDSGEDLIVGGAGDDSVVGGSDNDNIAGSGGNDVISGNAGSDAVYGVGGDDALNGGRGDDLVGGGAGNDAVRGNFGDDFMSGAAGDDLIVGGAGNDSIFGGDGADIMGGGAGNDNLTGNAGRDEFHFDAGTGSDNIRDFTQGEDVISFLDGGAISFADSEENDTRGDSDLAASDFDTIGAIAELEAANDQQAIYSTGGNADLVNNTGAQVEAYISATDGSDTLIYYDADWSDLDGRELIATLDDFNSQMTVSDFDVY